MDIGDVRVILPPLPPSLLSPRPRHLHRESPFGTGESQLRAHHPGCLVMQESLECGAIEAFRRRLQVRKMVTCDTPEGQYHVSHLGH
jgi:hypothetical protein